MAKKFKDIDETAPRPGREGGIFEESQPSTYKKSEPKKKKKPETSSMLIKDMDYELMEKLKNIVFTEKTHGDYFATQSGIAIKAIEHYIANYDKKVIERPERVKETERKLRRR